MNTLLGASSRSLARLFLNDSSEPPQATSSSHQQSDQHDSMIAQNRTFSVRKNAMISSSRSTNGVSNMIRSLSYRMDRARKRQVFLSTYTLESVDKPRVSKRAKRAFSKVKVLLVSAVTCCSRVGIIKRWNCYGNTYASSPSSR